MCCLDDAIVNPIDAILPRITACMVMGDVKHLKYLVNHSRHIIRELDNSPTPQEWMAHELRCKECMTYILRFEMLPIDVYEELIEREGEE